MTRAPQRTRQRRWLLLIIATLSLGTGCNRAFYRNQADDEVYALIERGTCDPRWSLDDYVIQVGPHSRMWDPTCPDSSPMPPDDPVSHRLMHCVDGKRGWKGWHRNGDLQQVDYEAWIDDLPFDEQGRVPVDLDRAVILGLVHSRNYQQQLEELYLSALDVTFERFRFNAQFFGGYDTFFTADGRLPPGAAGQTATTFSAGRTLGLGARNGTLGFSQLFPAGGQLVAGFANNLVWQFSGPDQFRPTTTLGFTFVQPLLALGGRRRVLERLTLSERTLLANVREMYRYRQAFYVNLATGRDAGNGPQRRGGLLGGSGFENFAGVGGGGFGGVGTTQQTVNSGSFTGGAGAAQAGGFLGLLQQRRQIENQRANVEELRRSHQELQDRVEDIGLLQVNQAGQALADATSRLLTSETQYETALDTYKLTLGLPPELPLEVADARLDAFRLLQPDMRAYQEEVSKLVIQLQPSPAGADDLDSYRAALVRCQKVLAALEEQVTAAREKHLPVIETNRRQLEQNTSRRREELRRAIRMAEERKLTILPGGEQALVDRIAEIDLDLAKLRWAYGASDAAPPAAAGQVVDQSIQLSTAVAALRQQLEAVAALADNEWGKATGGLPRTEASREVASQVVDLFDQVWQLAFAAKSQAPDLWLTFARTQLESLSLPQHELTPEDAYCIAQRNRLDWMNARASVVDSWRLIEFNANALQSNLSVVFSGDISNSDNQPFRLRGDAGRLTAGLQFDAPLNRLAERNLYRQSLIEFQQARRNFLLYEDRIMQSLRNTLRTMELNQINFELRRQAVWTALAQTEQAQLNLSPPRRPGEDPVTTRPSPTLARDLVSALADFLNTQNDFLSVWVNFHVLRIQLDMDLGTMQLDERGVWVDPGVVGALGLSQMPCEGNEEWAPWDKYLSPQGSAAPADGQDAPSAGPPTPEEIPQGNPVPGPDTSGAAKSSQKWFKLRLDGEPEELDQTLLRQATALEAVDEEEREERRADSRSTKSQPDGWKRNDRPKRHAAKQATRP